MSVIKSHLGIIVISLAAFFQNLKGRRREKNIHSARAREKYFRCVCERHILGSVVREFFFSAIHSRLSNIGPWRSLYGFLLKLSVTAIFQSLNGRGRERNIYIRRGRERNLFSARTDLREILVLFGHYVGYYFCSLNVPLWN